MKIRFVLKFLRVLIVREGTIFKHEGELAVEPDCKPNSFDINVQPWLILLILFHLYYIVGSYVNSQYSFFFNCVSLSLKPIPVLCDITIIMSRIANKNNPRTD